jgi:hypothetical protein
MFGPALGEGLDSVGIDPAEGRGGYAARTECGSVVVEYFCKGVNVYN